MYAHSVYVHTLIVISKMLRVHLHSLRVENIIFYDTISVIQSRIAKTFAGKPPLQCTLVRNQVQQTKVTSVLTEPQRALLSTITAGHEVIHIAETELSTKAQLPELGTDPASLRWIEQTIDTHKQNVGSQIAAMNAATAQVVTLTSGPADNVDHTAVGAAITTIATNLPEMTKGVRMIAALMDDESSGERLLDAARKLCSAFSDLLKATEPETKEVSLFLQFVIAR